MGSVNALVSPRSLRSRTSCSVRPSGGNAAISPVSLRGLVSTAYPFDEREPRTAKFPSPSAAPQSRGDTTRRYAPTTPIGRTNGSGTTSAGEGGHSAARDPPEATRGAAPTISRAGHNGPDVVRVTGCLQDGNQCATRAHGARCSRAPSIGSVDDPTTGRRIRTSRRTRGRSGAAGVQATPSAFVTHIRPASPPLRCPRLSTGPRSVCRQSACDR